MRVILHMAISLNGMIARENDDTDFLSHENWIIFVELARQAGAMIWGRKTHEIVRGYGPQFFQDLEGLKRVVISASPQLEVEPGWELATSPQEALTQLTVAGAQQVLLVGGANLNTAFARAGLINEVIINIESVIVGQGIPLFAPQAFDLPLELVDMRRVRDRIVQLHYVVKTEA